LAELANIGAAPCMLNVLNEEVILYSATQNREHITSDKQG